MTPVEIISDDEINANHYGRWGSSRSPREVVNEGVLKAAFGFCGGSTMLNILLSHGLIHTRTVHTSPRLTKRGMLYARALVAGNFQEILRATSGAMPRDQDAAPEPLT